MAIGPTVVITDETTPDDLRECVTHLNYEAKRAPHIGGTADYPSNWDLWHARINAVLDELLPPVA